MKSMKDQKKNLETPNCTQLLRINFCSAKQMAKIVNVSQQTISSHLKAMGKSHKLGKRMSQELTDKGKTEKSLENFICKDTIDNHRCIEFILTRFPDLFSVC